MPAWLSSVRDLVAEASPRRRFTLALLIFVPLGALAAAYIWFNPPAYRVLYGQLSDRAGGEVIGALEQLGIPYRLSAGDGRIEVPVDALHVARYRLAALGLPRSDADVEADVERAPSFGLSSLQQQQRQQRALEKELARSIQSLEAVELARVHLAIPKVSPFLRDAPRATAAVLVRLHPRAQLSAGQVTTIQTLVAAAVPRMKRTDVQVLDPRGVVLGGAAPEIEPSLRVALEQDLARRALGVLTPWLGAERVSVQVTATLEDAATRETVERVRRVAGEGPARPLEKTVRTTVEPEGRVRRIDAIVILAFDAAPDEIRKVDQLARQALGLQPARGDALNVYALPLARRDARERGAAEPSTPSPAAAVAPARPAPPPVEKPASSPVSLALAAALAGGALVLGGWLLSRRRAPASGEAAGEDFDAELDATRAEVLADPRVAADVIKLWMRA